MDGTQNDNLIFPGDPIAERVFDMLFSTALSEEIGLFALEAEIKGYRITWPDEDAKTLSRRILKENQT